MSHAIYLASGSTISVKGEEFLYRASRALFTEGCPISRSEATLHVAGKEFYEVTVKDGSCRTIVERIDGAEKADLVGVEALDYGRN